MCGKRRAGSTPGAIGFRQQEAEIVSSFKHLGTAINQKLSFTENIYFMYKKEEKKKQRL